MPYRLVDMELLTVCYTSQPLDQTPLLRALCYHLVVTDGEEKAQVRLYHLPYTRFLQIQGVGDQP